MIQATGKWMSRFATDVRTVSGMCGLAAGTAWVSISAVWWSAFEPLWPARAAWGVAVVAALMLLSLSWVQTWLVRIPQFWRVGIAACGMASWPMLWMLIATRRETFPAEWFTQDTTNLAATTLLAFGAVFPAVLLGCVPALSPAGRQRQIPGGSSFWLGVAAAWAVMPTTLFSRVPADRVLLIVAAALLFGAGLSLLLKRDDTEAASVEIPDAASKFVWWQQCLALVACGAVALAIEVALRTGEQLVIDSLPFKLIGWSGFLVGMSVSLWSQYHELRTNLRRTLIGLGIACGVICWLFSTWMSLAIWSSAAVESFAGIVFYKGMIPFLTLAPLGWVLGRLCQVLRPAMVLGVVAASWCCASRFALPMGLVLTSVSISALAASVALWSPDTWRELVRSRGHSWATPRLAAVMGLLVAAWFGSSALDLNRSSRLVFNGESFAAAANGHDLDTMARSDRSRLMNSFDDAGTQWSLWRQRGCQLMVRRNGIAVSGMTTDTGMSPQNLWPILSTTMPLVLHPQADDVLCIGPAGMAEVDALLTFPIQSLTCVSSSATEQAVLREQALLSGTEQRWSDGRLAWKTIAPSHFAHSRDAQTYDVIIVPDGVVASAARQPQLTPEFHAAMAARLNDEGIFCQRLSISDFGSTPVVEILRSLNTTFRQVSIVTTEDGSELLLLATNSEYPIVDDQLAKRLETPHVRKLCAQLGGDWSMLTQLAYVTPEKVQEITGAHAPGNRTLSGQFALRLASEALRWGTIERQEKQELFAERATLVLVAMELTDDAEQIIARRIQDSQARTKILAETPDNQWAYRREVKEALKNRPRTKIQKVNNEIRQTLDEYDQRRKEYFLALGAANRQLSLESISNLEQFAEPYDPLLTDFVHFEAAYLLGRASQSDPAREYRNWLHCIGYAPVKDLSVRPVVAAMDLLRRHPEIVGDPALRWEQHGALLDAMRLRWVNRWQKGTATKYDAADIQNSSVAISATLNAMDDLAATAGIDADTWKVQRQVWEDTLQSPLRERQGATPPQDQMLETVRQEWQRRNAELGETK